MKRIVKIAFALALLILIPSVLVRAQEKKTGQKVKIVVAEKGGTKVIIDTTFTNLPKVDSIKLKDGKVIYLAKHDCASAGLTHVSEGEGKVMVIVTTGDEDGKEMKKEIKVISGDSIMCIKHGDGEDLFIVKEGKHIENVQEGKAMNWTISEGDEKGNIIYINEGRAGLKEGEKKFNIEVITDESGMTVEKTNYVLAKDGMVISIEGGSEEKVREVAEMIEAKLGIAKYEKGNRQVVKEETKKTVKK